MPETKSRVFRERPLLASMRAATPGRVAVVVVIGAAVLALLAMLGLL